MRYPQHIAIIPDGNRSWAEDQGMPQIEGHLAGQKNSLQLVEHIFSTSPVQVATFWGLSSENKQNRPQDELDYLFEIYTSALGSLDQILEELQVNFRRIGNREGLPEHTLKDLEATVQKHTYPTKKTCVFAVNYGGRDEIVRGVKNWFASVGDISKLTADSLSKCMDLGDLPPVELVIRTKGDLARRTSGFLSWRIGYAELYFTATRFPAFDTDELEKAFKRFDSVAAERNFGK